VITRKVTIERGYASIFRASGDRAVMVVKENLWKTALSAYKARDIGYRQKKKAQGEEEKGAFLLGS